MNLPRIYRKLDPSFYQSEDVVMLAKLLLGKLLVSQFDGELTSGIIVETEAYRGVVDKASHAYGNRRTGRTEVMFAGGGSAYVYLCYGIHHLFNVVSGPPDVPHAILIRAIEPVEGKDIMLLRSGKEKWDNSIGSGPGNVAKALGIHTRHSGTSLLGHELFIADNGISFRDTEIVSTPRIGVDYAGEDAALQYRFVVKGHPSISARTFTSKFYDH
jgi:DNA-3-methyladenine glycosylase